MPSPTPLALTWAFTALTAVVAAVAAWSAARVAATPNPTVPRALLTFGVAAAWMALWALVARSGALLDFERRPPPMMLMMLASIVAALALGLSPLGARLARGLPLAALVGFQAFRLPLELLMDRAARAGAMPVQMSFEGYNFDIVTGASALVVAGLIAAGRAPRALVVAWNILGIALLANIGVIAVASTPLFHAFGTAPQDLNTWVATAPFVWLPTVLVACALAGHLFLTRRLLMDRAAARA
jgi:hypothetical protein